MNATILNGDYLKTANKISVENSVFSIDVGVMKHIFTESALKPDFNSTNRFFKVQVNFFEVVDFGSNYFALEVMLPGIE